MLQELILDGTNRCFDQQSSNQIVTEQEISSFCDHLYHHALKLCPSEISQKQLQKVSKSQLLSWKLLTEKDAMKQELILLVLRLSFLTLTEYYLRTVTSLYVLKL